MKKILIIGGGSIGERHLRCFLKTERADVSLCELSSEIRQRLGKDYPISNTFSALEQVPFSAFDAAVICTPAHLHIEMAQLLAENNLALLIEKPLSVSLEGTESLQQLIEERRLSVAVAYVHRVHPALQSMKRAMETGRFGEPLQVVVNSGQHFPLYRPAYREIYYADHSTGGGAIQDALTHMLNVAEWIVGPITELVADAKHCLLEGVEVEDMAHIITRHGDVAGLFSLNQFQAPNETTLTVVCTAGTIRYEAHNARWLSCIEPGADWQIEEQFHIERDDLFIKQANAFLDQIEGKREPVCSLAEAVQTLRVNLAALESVHSRQWKQL